MDSVFFSGSISIKTLPDPVKWNLDNIKDKAEEFKILVGDADGFDALLQKYCAQIGLSNVTVYTIFDNPRNHEAGFSIKKVDVPEEVRGGRKRQTFKDKKMTFDADISYVVWDEKSQGSFNNIIRALENNKKIRVFSAKARSVIKDVTIDNITKIYFNSNGFTAKDLLNHLLNKGVKDFDNVKQLNNYLVEQKYIEKIKSSSNKVIYKSMNSEYAIDDFHQGKQANAKFTFKLVKHLLEKFQRSNDNQYALVRG